jgi:hypothetical protein
MGGGAQGESGINPTREDESIEVPSSSAIDDGLGCKLVEPGAVAIEILSDRVRQLGAVTHLDVTPVLSGAARRCAGSLRVSNGSKDYRQVCEIHAQRSRGRFPGRNVLLSSDRLFKRSLRSQKTSLKPQRL